MVSQYRGSKKDERKVAGMRRLHKLEQSLSERSFPPSSNRSIGRRNGGLSSNEFPYAFQGYHQIPLALDDQEKTFFVTPIGNYHYKVMPFGLKNAGSTYWRMMTKMFESQMGKNIEVYIDDMVVKSKIVSEHIRDLTNIFKILRGHKFLLNASKCSFGVGSGKFLDYMVTH